MGITDDMEKMARAQEKVRTLGAVPARSLARKVAEIMSAVSYVPKAGHNDHFNYSFAQEGDVLAQVRPEMAKRNLAMLPNVTAHNVRTVQGGNGMLYVTDLVVVFTLMDGDSGEERTVTVIGQGEDNHDKGANKALTAATKYALLKLFLIPTGADPDADAPAEEVPRQSAPSRPTAQRDPAPASGSRPSPQQRPTTTQQRASSAATFPFGKQKGKPIAGAPLKDLQWFAKVTMESLADPAKERFKAANAALLVDLKQEIARQEGNAAAFAGGPSDNEPPPPGDDDAPF